MSICRKLLETLKVATVERQVEDAYNEMLKAEFPGIELTYPYGCDGYFEFDAGGGRHRAIVEYKFDEDMSSKTARSKVLAQVLFYMKRFELDGRPLPTVVLVADKNECFALHANDLVKWLDFDAKWDGAPSNAGRDNPELVLALAGDESRNAFVFDVGDGFDFSAVAQKMRDMASGTVRKIRVTERNVDKVFGVFSKKVVSEPKYPPNDMVALFFAAVTGSGDVYLHPAKKNRLVANGREVRVDAGAWRAFCGHFATTCSPKEKARLSAVCDRLIADATRRRQGAFFTPTEWCREAHRRLEAFLGEDWREECVVVDTSCGTKNLERDYRFKELYLSTLEPSELEISKQYCPEAKAAAALDFLNSTDEELFAALPGLEDALKADRKVVWLMNPPYATAGEAGATGKAKGGLCKTKINELMKAARLGNASEQLYAQFLYRIMLLKKKYKATNFVLAFFCKPNYLTSGTFKKFRGEFFREFRFKDGMLFNAGHFADTSANWGINFSIWSSDETIDKNVFKHDLMDVNDDGDVAKVGEKNICNIDGKTSLTDWCRAPVENLPKKDFPNFKSAIKMKTDGTIYNKCFDGALGYFTVLGPAVQSNGQDISMSSIPFSRKNGGFGISKDNFSRCCAAFAARRLVKGDWINDKDEYTAPNVDDPTYKNFEADSFVFNLFDSNSQQSSLRGVSYKGKSWDILNQFFFVPSKDMAEWADEAGLDAAYAEANAAPDRHMVKALADAEPFMSDEAKAVLAEARRLVRASMKYRALFDDEHPEYQVRNFDAGWYQVKAVLKEYMPEELKKFRELVRKLADRMRPAVYGLGFLRR